MKVSFKTSTVIALMGYHLSNLALASQPVPIELMGQHAYAQRTWTERGYGGYENEQHQLTNVFYMSAVKRDDLNPSPLYVDCHYPRAVLVQPYGDRRGIRKNGGQAMMPLVMHFGSQYQQNLPYGLQQKIIQANIRPENVEIMLCAQDFPWVDNTAVGLRPHYKVFSALPDQRPFDQAVDVEAGIFNVIGEPLAFLGDATVMQTPVSIHGDEYDVLPTTTDRLRINGLSAKGHAFWSYVQFPAQGQVKLVATLHWLLNDNQAEELNREFHERLREGQEWEDFLQSAQEVLSGTQLDLRKEEESLKQAEEELRREQDALQQQLRQDPDVVQVREIEDNQKGARNELRNLLSPFTHSSPYSSGKFSYSPVEDINISELSLDSGTKQRCDEIKQNLDNLASQLELVRAKLDQKFRHLGEKFEQKEKALTRKGEAFDQRKHIRNDLSDIRKRFFRNMSALAQAPIFKESSHLTLLGQLMNFYAPKYSIEVCPWPVRVVTEEEKKESRNKAQHQLRMDLSFTQLVHDYPGARSLILKDVKSSLIPSRLEVAIGPRSWADARVMFNDKNPSQDIKLPIPDYTNENEKCLSFWMDDSETGDALKLDFGRVEIESDLLSVPVVTETFHLGHERVFPFTLEGFTGGRGDHRWTHGIDGSTITVPAVQGSRHVKSLLFRDTKSLGEQIAYVSVNDKPLGSYHYSNNSLQTIEIPFPLNSIGDVKIHFNVPTACSLADLGVESEDHDVYGILFREVDVTYFDSQPRLPLDKEFF